MGTPNTLATQSAASDRSGLFPSVESSLPGVAQAPEHKQTKFKQNNSEPEEKPTAELRSPVSRQPDTFHLKGPVK
jgi:hypothetical protein